MPINTIKVYNNLMSALYAKRLIFKAVVAISVVFVIVSEWVTALLVSFVLIKVALLNVKFPKIVK